MSTRLLASLVTFTLGSRVVPCPYVPLSPAHCAPSLLLPVLQRAASSSPQTCAMLGLFFAVSPCPTSDLAITGSQAVPQAWWTRGVYYWGDAESLSAKWLKALL